MKTIVKLLGLSLFASIIPAPMMAMEEPDLNPICVAIDVAVQDAFYDNFEKLKHLLSSGIPANPLFHRAIACINNPNIGRNISQEKKEEFAKKLVDFLFDFGFDINWPILNGEYKPLKLATLENLPELAKYLVKLGADMNHQEPINRFPVLMWAIIKKQVELAQFFIENGAEVNPACNDGNNILSAAIIECSDVIQLLLQKGAQVEDRHLIEAIAYNTPEALQLLLEQGTDPNHPLPKYAGSFRGESLLHVACLTPVLRSTGDTALQEGRLREDKFVEKYHTALKNTSNFVQLLLDFNAKINAQDEKGETPLMICASFLTKDHRKAFQDELEIDCEEICPNLDDLIPVAKLLLDRGADRDIRNHAGQTARDIAALQGNTAMVELLDNYRPWGAAALKLKAAKALLVKCAHAETSAEDAKALIEAVPADIRNAVCLIAPKVVKDKIGFNPVLQIESASTQNSNNENE